MTMGLFAGLFFPYTMPLPHHRCSGHMTSLNSPMRFRNRKQSSSLSYIHYFLNLFLWLSPNSVLSVSPWSPYLLLFATQSIFAAGDSSSCPCFSSINSCHWPSSAQGAQFIHQSITRQLWPTALFKLSSPDSFLSPGNLIGNGVSVPPKVSPSDKPFLFSLSLSILSSVSNINNTHWSVILTPR